MQPADDFRQISDMLEEEIDIAEPDTGVLEQDTGVIEPDTGVLERDTGVFERIIRSDSIEIDITSEIEAIHNGYRQEIQQYQTHLADLMEERNQLMEEHHALESRYQDLYYNFLASVEEEAHKMVQEAARTVTLSPNSKATHPLLRDAVQTLELHAQQIEGEHSARTLYVMREAQRKAALLEKELQEERQQIAEERQNLITMQNSVREQAQLRYQTIQSRLQVHWLLRLIRTVGIVLVVLLLGQLLLLSLLHVPRSASLFIAIFAPLFLCPIAVYAYVHVRKSILYIYHGAPHRVKPKSPAQQKA